MREYEEVTLDVIRQYMSIRISQEMLDDYGFETVVKRGLDDIIVAVQRTVAGQHLKPYYEQYPKDWIQAVKERFAPLWLKKRFPVKYTFIKLDVDLYYPDIKIPEQPHHYVVRYSRSADEWRK